MEKITAKQAYAMASKTSNRETVLDFLLSAVKKAANAGSYYIEFKDDDPVEPVQVLFDMNLDDITWVEKELTKLGFMVHRYYQLFIPEATFKISWYN